MVAVPRRGQLGEHPAQRGLAEPAYGPRGEPQPVVAAAEVALLLQLALQVPQGPEVPGGLRAEPLLQQVHVDVVQGRAGLTLAELGLQGLQVGQLGHGLDGVAVAQRLSAGPHPRRGVPVQPGPQRPQVVAQLSHLGGEVGVTQRLAHQLAELLALLRAERGQHPLRGGLPAGQRVDQLLDALPAARGRTRRAWP